MAKKRKRGRPPLKFRRLSAFARRLVAARTALGMTQEAVARELEVAWRTYIRYELGEREPKGPALRFIDGWIAGAASRAEGRPDHAKKA